MASPTIDGGCYPAAITPLTDRGEVDPAGMARLLAWFESQGCAGAVLAGTNGEGPSLSAVEKRDLLREVMPARGRLNLILGVATSSLTEAIWSCRQAAKIGAGAALLMAPSYFREAPEAGIEQWLLDVMDQADLPVLVYNFPQRTGMTLSADLLARVGQHPNMAGAKDSSGDESNLAAYARSLPGKALFVGNETLLPRALDAGWTGTISGAANVLPGWLSEIVRLWQEGDRDQAELKFKVIRPALEALRRAPQPAMNKAILREIGLLDRQTVRLPLTSTEVGDSMRDALHGLVQWA